MEKIIIDKNLQFLGDITELGNLNGNGVSWREKTILELTLTTDDDDSVMLELEVVGVVRPDLRLMFSFNFLIITSILSI